MRSISILVAAISAMALTSCKDAYKEEAQEILKEAQQCYDKGQYAQTLHLIDSLRASHPKAIEEREKALTLFQQASEMIEQDKIKDTDRLLQQAQREYDEALTAAEEHKRTGTATAAELDNVTKLRIRRDSIEVQFNTQCAKVRLIRSKKAQTKTADGE